MRIRIHPLLVASLLLFIALAAGCSSGNGVLPEGTGTTDELQAATFEGGDNFVDLTGEGVALALTDAEGNGLPDVEVYLDGEPAAFTDENGEYTLWGLTDEDSELTFAVDGIEFYSTTVSSLGRTAETADPDPDIERGKVFGVVHDADGPVVHALVIIVQGDHFAFDWSGPEGGYVINDAPAGPGAILCFAKEHKPFHDGIVVFPDDPVQKNIFLLKAPINAQLGGLVVDDHFWPVKHARVTYHRPDKPPITVFTNQYGAYGFHMLPVGPGMITIEAFGFKPGGGPVDVHPGKNLKHWMLERLPFGGIEGKVLGIGENIPEPVPIPHAKVVYIKVIDENQPPIVLERFTDELGRYRFNFLPLGHCELKAGAPGWSIESDTAFVVEGQWVVKKFLLHKLPGGGDGGDG